MSLAFGIDGHVGTFDRQISKRFRWAFVVSENQVNRGIVIDRRKVIFHLNVIIFSNLHTDTAPDTSDRTDIPDRLAFVMGRASKVDYRRIRLQREQMLRAFANTGAASGTFFPVHNRQAVLTHVKRIELAHNTA